MCSVTVNPDVCASAAALTQAQLVRDPGNCLITPDGGSKIPKPATSSAYDTAGQQQTA